MDTAETDGVIAEVVPGRRLAGGLSICTRSRCVVSALARADIAWRCQTPEKDSPRTVPLTRAEQRGRTATSRTHSKRACMLQPSTPQPGAMRS